MSAAVLLPVFAGVAIAITLLRMRWHKESLLEYLWPVDRKVGLRPVAIKPTLSKFQSWGAAIVAFCDLWFRCAPFSVPEVCLFGLRRAAEAALHSCKHGSPVDT